MSKIPKEVWDILTSDEKAAVELKLGHSKSTWEAGEIMKKAHYKFLEILRRAETYIKMFTEHFELYDQIIPDYLGLDERVRQYFIETIINRKTIRAAVDSVEDDTNAFIVKPFREKIISENLMTLHESDSVVDRNFVTLILEFDRWNNYRILPKNLQEPSAFKRRNKNNDKKTIKAIKEMNTLTIEVMRQRFEYTKYKKESNVYWVPVFSKFLDDGDNIIPIRKKEKILQVFSKLGMYVFNKKKHAQHFIDILYGYDTSTTMHCKDGQVFWPKYRVVIKDAINFDTIQKLIPNRKFLETFQEDADYRLARRKPEDIKPRKKRKKNIPKY